jgi:hypothetical protein
MADPRDEDSAHGTPEYFRDTATEEKYWRLGPESFRAVMN